MRVDIRLLIGAMFLTIGALLVGYGAQREHAMAHGIEALAAEPW